MKPAARHRARKLALQALYQILLSDQPAHEVAAEYLAQMNPKKVDMPYFEKLVLTIPKELEEIDACFSPYLARPLADLTPIELCVLRLATFELKHHLEIPYPIIINEALELTKVFGAQDGFKFVNGVLDKTASNLREIEYRARG